MRTRRRLISVTEKLNARLFNDYMIFTPRGGTTTKLAERVSVYLLQDSMKLYMLLLPVEQRGCLGCTRPAGRRRLAEWDYCCGNSALPASDLLWRRVNGEKGIVSGGIMTMVTTVSSSLSSTPSSSSSPAAAAVSFLRSSSSMSSTATCRGRAELVHFEAHEDSSTRLRVPPSFASSSHLRASTSTATGWASTVCSGGCQCRTRSLSFCRLCCHHCELFTART